MRSINPKKASKISLGVPCKMWLMGNFTTRKPSTPKKSERRALCYAALPLGHLFAGLQSGFPMLASPPPSAT